MTGYERTTVALHIIDAGDYKVVLSLFSNGRLISVGEVVEGEKTIEALLYRNLQL